MALIYGRENVIASPLPQQLFGILKQLRPTALIVAPDLFEQNRIAPEDINAYRKEMRYRVIALYRNEKALETKNRFSELQPDREYISPTEYFSMAKDIKSLCTNPYTKRKAPLKSKTEENLDRIFRECGFRNQMKGAAFLKEALCELYFNPNLHNTGGGAKLYRMIAKRHDTTPRIAERSIQRFLEQSWIPATEEALRRELAIPEFYSFHPIGFGKFTHIFNTYYTIKFGNPENLLKPKP